MLYILVIVLLLSTASTAFSFMLWKTLLRATSVDVLASLQVVSERVAELYARKSPVSSAFESDALVILRTLDERIKPPAPPPMAPEVVSAIIDRAAHAGCFAAEEYALQLRRANPKEFVPSTDKLREALKTARAQLATAGIDLPDAELAKHIVATHATLKGLKQL